MQNFKRDRWFDAVLIADAREMFAANRTVDDVRQMVFDAVWNSSDDMINAPPEYVTRIVNTASGDG